MPTLAETWDGPKVSNGGDTAKGRMASAEAQALYDEINLLQPKIGACLAGFGAPSSDLGEDGQGYVDLSNDYIYGPKDDGAWGSPRAIAVGLTAYLDWKNRGYTFGGLNTFQAFLDSLKGPAQLFAYVTDLASIPDPAPVGTTYILVAELP